LVLQYSLENDMRDNVRLMITGIVAVGALAWTIGGSGLSFSIGDDDADSATHSAHGGSHKTSVPFPLKDFDGVVLAGPDNVTITQGKTFAVRADGDSRALDKLKLSVDGGTLTVGRESGSSHDRGATIFVTMPVLARVSLTGPGDMKIDKMMAPKVKASITGPGNISIADIQADEADLDLAGSGDLNAAGHVKTARLSALGSGDVRAEKLETETATLRLVGSGDIRVRARQSADVSLLGSGDAHVMGTTQCKVSKMGSGDADCAS
jgi:hypothetical protein